MRPAGLLGTLWMGMLVASAADAGPDRLAWIGLERGPLAPAEAEKLEKLILDDLDGYDSFRLVDASGHALDARLLASEAALVARLKDQGVKLSLEFKGRSALKKFDQAIDVFESRLIALTDYELLHDALLAKAEAQYQSKKKTAAKTTLQRLAALGPKRFPTERTHPAGLVKLWRSAKESLGPVGTINVICEGCTVQIDGQLLGPGPLLATRIPPGKHYLVAKWVHGSFYDTVQVAPGLESKAVIERKGPSEDTRQAMLQTIERREGQAAAEQVAKKAVRLSRTAGVLIAAVKKTGDKRSLIVARHDRKGRLVAVVKAPLQQIQSEKTAAMVGRIGALLFVEKKSGGQEIKEDGTAGPEESLNVLLYESAGAAAPPPPPPRPPPPKDIVDQPPPPPPPPPWDPDPGNGGKDEEGIASKWWFWTIVGVVAVGAGVGVGVGVASQSGGNRTEFEVVLP